MCTTLLSHRLSNENSLPNLNILGIRCDGRDNTKGQCGFNSWVKRSENNMDIIGLLDRGKDPLLLLYTYISFSSNVCLLLHVQYYQSCEPMIIKKQVQSKFVLCQARYYNLSTEKKYKKIHVFELIIFLKMYRYCQYQGIFFKHHLQTIHFVETLWNRKIQLF